jgi:transcriptional regulator with XRE-family HTH domain
MTNTMSGPDNAPLHERIVEERGRRGWTQEEVAAKAGMSLRAYNSFENGRSKPQGKNMRGILSVFELDPSASDEDERDETLETWPPEVHVFLDMLGAFLMTMTEAERLVFIHDETRRVIGYNR